MPNAWVDLPLFLPTTVHEIQEIRVRALHDIENKLKRALWENVDLCFNGAALFKNLIRWFGQNPICEEVTVLELMSLLLTVKYPFSCANQSSPAHSHLHLSHYSFRASMEERLCSTLLQIGS